MDLNALLTKVRLRQAEVKRQRLQGYGDLVGTLAGGSDLLPPPEQIVAILDDAGKTADELAHDVELLTKRRGWQELVDALPALQQEMGKLNQEREQLDAQFKREYAELKARFQARFQTIDDAIRKNFDDQGRGNDAVRNLYETSGRMKEITELHRQAMQAGGMGQFNTMDRLTREHRQHAANVLRLQRELRQLEATEGEGPKFDRQVAALKRELSAAQAKRAENERERQKLQAASERFLQKAREIEAQALVAG